MTIKKVLDFLEPAAAGVADFGQRIRQAVRENAEIVKAQVRTAASHSRAVEDLISMIDTDDDRKQGHG